VDIEESANLEIEFLGKRDDRRNLQRITDNDGFFGTHNRTDGGLRQSLARFVNQQPSNALGRQVAEHPADRRKRRRDRWNDHEEGGPEIAEKVLLGLTRSTTGRILPMHAIHLASPVSVVPGRRLSAIGQANAHSSERIRRAQLISGHE
jgi:hypothetical protein